MVLKLYCDECGEEIKEKENLLGDGVVVKYNKEAFELMKSNNCGEDAICRRCAAKVFEKGEIVADIIITK